MDHFETNDNLACLLCGCYNDSILFLVQTCGPFGLYFFRNTYSECLKSKTIPKSGISDVRAIGTTPQLKSELATPTIIKHFNAIDECLNATQMCNTYTENV